MELYVVWDADHSFEELISMVRTDQIIHAGRLENATSSWMEVKNAKNAAMIDAWKLAWMQVMCYQNPRKKHCSLKH